MRRRLYVPLVVLVVMGIGLRIWAAASFWPAVMNLADSSDYILYSHTSLFNDVVRPAGYSLFVKVVGWSSSSAAAPILLQHLMGVATALLAYGLVRRAGAPRWAALLPAAVVLLSFDQVALEHQFMPEALFTLLIVGSAYAAIRALSDAHRTGRLRRSSAAWLAVAGALLGLAAYVRSVALLMAPFLALWALFALPKPWWRSRVAGSAVALAAVVFLGVAYSTAHEVKSGHFGFTRFGGWATYIRTAQFADCSKFTPPPGTRRLCERSDSAARPGGDFYAWEAGSPARQLFGRPPYGGEALGAFGRAAIVHQPLAYVETVFNDFVRFFAPTYNDDRPFSGPGFDVLDLNRRAPPTEAAIVQMMGRWYSESELTVRDGPARAFDDLQQLARVHGVILLQLALVAAAGLFVRPSIALGATALLLGGGLLLLLVPAATVLYNARYSVPAGGLLAAAAALSVWSLVQRMLRRQPETLMSARGPS